MSSAYPPQPKRTWRPPVVPSRQPLGGEPRWRRDPAIGWGRWLWRLRFGLVMLALVACAGLLVWASLWLTPPKPACLVLVGAGYETNLAVPHNVPGREGLKNLAALADLKGSTQLWYDWSAGLLKVKHPPLELLSDMAWDAGLDKFDERTVIVYLALHGGADATRGPYLLRGDATGLGGDKERLYVEDVLARLKQVPRSKNVVLMLDATQVPALPGQGMLHNDFARELDRLEGRIDEIPNLVVLSASGLDQRSWACEEWRETVFGHYVARGMRGGPKGAVDENGDHRIDAWELYRYVTENVERWARTNRQALQMPVLRPQGTPGEERARRMQLTMVAAGDPPADAAPPAFEPPPRLAQAWQECRQRGEQVPSPAAYTPHLWREYQAALVRYEELLRFGDDESAARLDAQAAALGRALDEGRKLELASLDNSLAMPAAAGLTGEYSRAAVSLDDLWTATPVEYRQVLETMEKEWAKQPGGAEPAGRRLRRLKGCDLLVQAAAGNATSGLRRAHQLAPLLTDPGSPKPAEVHFLTMLARHLPPDPLPKELAEKVELALRVRRLAERAALGQQEAGPAYSEQVRPWVEPLVTEADRRRQLGQDLLFASDAASWNRACGYLKQAELVYGRALEVAGSVQKALAVRDQVFADLPAYSAWLARRRPADPARPQEEEENLDRVEKLWENAHQLARAVEQRPAEPPPLPDLSDAPNCDTPPAPPVNPKPDAYALLRRQADDVEQQFRAVEATFTASLRTLLAEPEGAAVWHDADAALGVPFREADLRTQVLAKARRSSALLLQKSAQKEGRAGSLTTEAMDKRIKENEKQARDAGVRQGRMALAALGKRWFDETAGGDREPFDRVRLGLLAASRTWWETLAVTGDQVGPRWRELSAAVKRNQLAASRKAVDPKEARAALQTADRLGRLLDGTTNAALSGNPADGYRRLLAHDLLLAQAQRTLLDHWFAEEDSPGADPYYQTAGLLYARDGAEVVRQPADAEALRVQDDLRKPGRLVLRRTQAGPMAVTTEESFDLEYELASSGDGPRPAGIPVFRLEPEKPLLAVSPAAGAWVAWGSPDRPAAGLRCTLTTPVEAQDDHQPPPGTGSARVAVRGFFRGQNLEQATTVEVHRQAARVYVQYPMPDARSLAVRAPENLRKAFGDGAGALTIVLDCSGSMEPDTPSTAVPPPPTKWSQVLTALETVLKQLPRGTTFSLWIFGQGGPTQPQLSAEDTIYRVQERTTWQYPDNPDQLRMLMEQLRGYRPWYQTPLMRTMLRAKEDLNDARGFKTMLVLTDGMDTRWAQDQEANRAGKKIPDVIREKFGNSGIAIHFVGFKFENESEAKAAAEQFRVVETLPVPGRFVTVDDADKLAAELGKALQPKLRYWVERDDGEALPGIEKGWDVSLSNENDRWFRLPDPPAPGGYKVRVLTNQRVQQSVEVNPGELLLLQLAGTVERQQLRRVFVSKDVYRQAPGGDTRVGDWRGVVLRNQATGAGDLQLALMLEKNPDVPEPTLKQVKPREVWTEVEPSGGDAAAVGLRWGFQPGYEAPAWTLAANRWPSGPAGLLRPTVQVWWDANQEPPTVGGVDRDAGRRTLLGLAKHPVAVEKGTVVIESVQVARQRVEVGPGKFDMRDCLMVRLSHPRDRTYKVRVGGLNVEGQEQRFYPGAGRCTALFWPVTEADAEKALASIGLVSIDAFKSAAAGNGHHLRIELDEPQPHPGDRPVPVKLR